MDFNKRLQKGKFRSLLAGLAIIPVLLLAGCGDGEKKCEKGNVLSGKACITLSGEFDRMPEDMLSKKYLSNQRPTEAWYKKSEDGKVSLSFVQTTQAMKDTQLSVFAGAMKDQLSAFSPKVTEGKVNGKKVVFLEMTTPDNINPSSPNVFSIMQLSSMNDKLLITTFSMTEDVKDKYYQEGKATLDSLYW